MSSTLSLVVLRDDKTVAEVCELAWMYSTIKGIIPKRKPDKASKKSRFWLISDEERSQFVSYMDKKLEENASIEESLYGYFGVMGISQRWTQDMGVRWGLYLSGNEVAVGERLKR